VTLLVLAGRDDAVGFALAGVPSVECTDRTAVRDALARADASVAVVLVTHDVEEVAADAVAAYRDRPGAPPVVVLPSPVPPPAESTEETQ